MAKFLGQVFRGGSDTAWKKEVKRAERRVWKARNEQRAPPFQPQNGVYEYKRRFDHNGKGSKDSCYHVVLHLSFFQAPDYGWQISGVGSERLHVRGVAGGEPRRIYVDDGRVTTSGKFYWEESRGKLQHLVTGSLEPYYKVVNGLMCVDREAGYEAYETISRNGAENGGKFTRHPLKNFIRQQDDKSHVPKMIKKQRPVRDGQKGEIPHDESTVEASTEFHENSLVAREVRHVGIITHG